MKKGAELDYARIFLFLRIAKHVALGRVEVITTRAIFGYLDKTQSC